VEPIIASPIAMIKLMNMSIKKKPASARGFFALKLVWTNSWTCYSALSYWSCLINTGVETYLLLSDKIFSM